MRRIKLNLWVSAIGLVVTVFGLVNVASVVTAFPSVKTEDEDQTCSASPDKVKQDFKAESWAEQPEPAQDQAYMDPKVEELPAPSVSFLAQDEIAETTSLITKDNERLLSELYAADMLYPQEVAEQALALPTPVAAEIPIRLIIPAIELDAPILPVQAEIVGIAGKSFQVWHTPDEYAVGWHDTSATLGVVGNTVLSGHHNIQGEVFKRLADLNPGDQVIVESDKASHRYVIVNRMVLPEKYAPLEDRIANAQWISPSEDERLTLITCWPYESNTHRLILVARPDNM
jgi:LPXTG-site transpeptidase (sortase) family protein